MSGSYSSSPIKEEYAVTIVSYVLAWYNQIGRGLTETKVIRETAEARGSFLKGEAAQLTELLTEVRANMEGFRRTYLLKEDAKDFQDIWSARSKVSTGPILRSEYGNQEAHNRFLAWARGEEEALWIQLESLREVMVKRKWFDLKKFQGFGESKTKY